jgi:hypothetical protein
MKSMKPWLWLVVRIGQGTLSFALGGVLVFAVAGLVEGALAGAVVALILLPTDKTLAAAVVTDAILIGTIIGIISGLTGYGIAGLLQSVRAELHYYHPARRYQPRDAPFWDCTRSALWASATLGFGGALTGAVCGGLWAFLIQPTSVLPSTMPRAGYEILCLLSGGAAGAALGFLAGVLIGALASDSVQTARQRVKSWREAVFHFAQSARTEWQR